MTPIRAWYEEGLARPVVVDAQQRVAIGHGRSVPRVHDFADFALLCLASPRNKFLIAMSALLKLLGPVQGKLLAAGAAGGAAVGTWQWQQARQALQSSGKSFDEIFDAADKDKNGTVDGEQSSRTPG